jgi:O-antigen ligase
VRIRPSGLFDHPIVLADVLLLSLPVMFAGMLLRGGRLWRMALGLALLIGIAGLALTLSRGAWISTACAAATLTALAARYRLATRRQLRNALLLGAVAAGALVLVFGPRAYERLTASDEGNLGVRFELNWIALSMMEAHPFAGVGLGNFIPEMEHYDPTNVKRRFPATVHNLYLLEGAEAGWPGLLLCLAVFGTVLAAGLSRLPGMPDPGARWVAAAILAGLVGFLLSQLADFSHRLEPLRSLLWMNVGWLFALQRAARPTAGAPGRTPLVWAESRSEPC